MEPQFSVLLYSKYSPYCKQITTMLEQSKVQIPLQPLCIDNEKIRSRIINNPDIEIKSVPTILLLFQDGGVEKYEGGTAFNWVEEIIKRLSPPPPPPPSSPPSPHPIQQKSFEKKDTREDIHKEQKSTPKRSTAIEDLPEEPEEESLIQRNAREYAERAKRERERESQLGPKNGPPMIRSNEGNYELAEPFGDTALTDHQIPPNTIKSDLSQSNGGNSVMATAAEMQKSREIEIEGTKPVGGPPGRRP